MKNVIKKYCSLKTATVLILLVSFNLVSFGQDIQNCLCKKDKEKVKHSCCMKKTETENKGCCKKTEKKSDCKETGNIESRKEAGTLNENKVLKSEIRLVNFETPLTFFSISDLNHNFIFSTCPVLKLYLSISTLRI